MKPKENLIEKIDAIHRQLRRIDTPSLDMSLVDGICSRCHTMNIHKAKVVYFKRIKLILGEALELVKQEQEQPQQDRTADFSRIEKDLRVLLDANNG